jgi:hypothetical protein
MPTATYTNFGGGINRKTIGSYLVPKGEDDSFMYAENINNMRVDLGSITKVNGFTAVANPTAGANAGQGIFSFKGELISCFNGKIYKGITTPTQVKTGASTTAKWTASEWLSSLVMCNGVDKPVVWNGTSASDITISDPSSIWNDARPKGSAVFRNRIFYWGDPSNPDTIYTPRPETIGNFDNTTSTVDFFTVMSGYGGAIKAVVPLTDDMLVIYKERCIYYLQGNAPFGSTGGEPFAIKPITQEVGCVIDNGVVSIGNEHYFFSQEGLRKLTVTQNFGKVAVEQPNYVIQDIINTVNFNTQTALDKATLVYVPKDNNIIIGLPTGTSTENDLVLTYDITTGANARRTGWKPTAMCIHKRDLYHTDALGNIYQHQSTVFNNNGTAYNAEFESKWIAHEGLMKLKRYKQLFIGVDPGFRATLNVRWYVLVDAQPTATLESIVLNGGALWDSAKWDEATWDDGGASLTPITNLGKGKAIKIILSCNNANEPIVIRSIDIEYEALSNKRG